MPTKKPNARPAESRTDAAAADALKTAYEIHTLAQMLYTRLAVPAVPAPAPPAIFH